MRCLQSISRFWKSERGNATVEVLPWIAVSGVVITLIVDAALTLQSFSEVLRNMQDTNRLVSIGLMRDPLVARTYLEQQIAAVYPGAQVLTVIDISLKQVETQIAIPWSSLNLIGVLARSGNPAITMTATHMLEWTP